ncbi:hypothetical protein TNCV_3474381 [Trichonephila clavipes]|nr:hypothetical protein TNCV_3474381 [Trichonephila clavipes]
MDHVPGLIVSGATLGTRLEFDVRDVSNLNRLHYITQVIRLHLIRGLGDVIFQQNNAISHVVRHVLTYLDTEDFSFLSWTARSQVIPSIKSIWSWVAERVRHHHFSSHCD